MNYLPRVNFDDYQNSYVREIQKSIDFIGQDHDFFTEVKVQLLLKLARRQWGSFSQIEVLDIGCGVGVTDKFLKKHFKRLQGVDIGKGIVGKARKLNPGVAYRVYDGKKLPFPNQSMDLTFAICVLHHIPPANLSAFLDEMKRVTKKNGLMVIFEHNPWNPLTRHAVDRCELDEDANLLGRSRVRSLFRKKQLVLLESPYIFFTAFRGSFFRWFDWFWGWLPLGAQYYVAGRK